VDCAREPILRHDGDLVFAASAGARPLADPVFALLRLGTAAMQAVARAIARGVYAAAAQPGDPHARAWRDAFGP
jgi:D-aminopeptidase